jgi:hypothetical protein
MIRRIATVAATVAAVGGVAVAAAPDAASAYNPCPFLQSVYEYHIQEGNYTYAIDTIGDLLTEYRCTG